jgi:hypothetical protein
MPWFCELKGCRWKLGMSGCEEGMFQLVDMSGCAGDVFEQVLRLNLDVWYTVEKNE